MTEVLVKGMKDKPEGSSGQLYEGTRAIDLNSASWQSAKLYVYADDLPKLRSFETLQSDAKEVSLHFLIEEGRL